MSVDMFERRFRRELEKLPVFAPNDDRDPRAWEAKFPAWHALFSSMCLFGHSTGYRLPSFEEFFRYCEHAYTKRHPDCADYVPLFKGERLRGMRQRVSAWYESGMAETYLYACLAEAIEDKSKLGVVLYDPRADWKLKADVIVIVNRTPLRVSAFVGEQIDRPGVEARRDVVERERKKNTMESAHWNNAELAAMPVFEVSRTDSDMQVVNGVRLFSLVSINRLLQEIYQKAEVQGWIFPQAASVNPSQP
jgi:hypothetical protein